MVPRDPSAPHRPATPLELLFDLCFVVAIAQAAAELHHSISHGHALEGTISFALVFFAIWWAWMGFTWFASAFDNDDALYRVKVLVQMVGVLVLAAGVPDVFASHDLTLVTVGFTIMRVGLVSQWLRVAAASREYRATALRYAIGISAVQAGWLALLAAPEELRVYGPMALIAAELAVPALAESARPTPWHPEHVAERYGLLTIIVIGESVLAATMAIQSGTHVESVGARIYPLAASAPLVFFSMWWLYFSCAHHVKLTSPRAAFLWGYSHYVLFAAAAAAGAGLAVAGDHLAARTGLTDFQATQSLAVPSAVFLLSLACIRGLSARRPVTSWGLLIAAALGVLAIPFVATSPLAIGLAFALTTALYVGINR